MTTSSAITPLRVPDGPDGLNRVENRIASLVNIEAEQRLLGALLIDNRQFKYAALSLRNCISTMRYTVGSSPHSVR